MTQLTQLVLFLAGGITAVTIIDTAGAWASRRFSFHYGYLAVVQFVVYILISFLICRFAGLRMAFLINLIVAFYDATVGLQLSLKFKANFKLTDAQLQEITISASLTAMLVIAVISTLTGYFLS